jgi:hypothetical protein
MPSLIGRQFNLSISVIPAVDKELLITLVEMVAISVAQGPLILFPLTIAVPAAAAFAIDDIAALDVVLFAAVEAVPNAGIKIPAKTAMIEITTNNSISVNRLTMRFNIISPPCSLKMS